MKPGLTFAIAALGATLTGTAVFAAGPANPYQDISRRNVFQLQPVPTQSLEPKPLPPRRPPPVIHITGLVEIGGVPKALVEITAPGRTIQRQILAAGGVCGELEMLQVDVAGDCVRVRIDGEEETLTIQKPRPGVAYPPGPPPLPMLRPVHPVRG